MTKNIIDDTMVQGDTEPINVVLTDNDEDYKGLELGSQNKSLDKQEDSDNDIGLKSDEVDDKVDDKVDDRLVDIDIPDPQGEVGDTTSDDDEVVEINSNSVSWKKVAEIAINEGLFTDTTIESLEEIDDDISEFSKIIQNELGKGIEVAKQEWIDNLDNQSQGLLSHIVNGGNIEDFVQVAANDYSKYTDDSLDANELLQEKLVKDYYKKTTQWSDDKINKFITKHKDLDELAEEAKFALGKMKDIQSKEQESLHKQTLERRKQNDALIKQRIDTLSKTIDNVDNFIGVKVTPKLRKTIKSNALENKTFAKINQNVDKYNVNLSILDALGLLDGDPSNITKLLESKATKEVKKKITDVDFTKGKVGGSQMRKSSKDKAVTGLIRALNNSSINF